jgi:CubicO group peptidase (beta-lactamase class C family)
VAACDSSDVAACDSAAVTAATLAEALRPHIEAGEVPGAVVGVLRDGDVSLQALGSTRPDGGIPLTTDAVFRISSNTKPLTAALTLVLAEAGTLALDDPAERYVPELAGRRVLRRVDGPLDDTVPAERTVTVHDLLTMRLGFGFAPEAECPAVRAAMEAGLGIGPPDPSNPLDADEWIARFAALPLLEQPGTAWRYDLAYAVLGVVLARAAGRPLDALFEEELLRPLGMRDTGFVAPEARLVPCFARRDGDLAVFDDDAGSRWATSPAFPDARGGLVSTASDLLRFAAALLDAGAGVLSERAVTLMTSDQLTPEERHGPSAREFLREGSWGYGMQVTPPARAPSARPARYGWAGGLGTLWYSWPEHHMAAVLLTQVLPPSGTVFEAFTGAMERSLEH